MIGRKWIDYLKRNSGVEKGIKTHGKKTKTRIKYAHRTQTKRESKKEKEKEAKVNWKKSEEAQKWSLMRKKKTTKSAFRLFPTLWQISFLFSFFCCCVQMYVNKNRIDLWRLSLFLQNRPWILPNREKDGILYISFSFTAAQWYSILVRHFTIKANIYIYWAHEKTWERTFKSDCYCWILSNIFKYYIVLWAIMEIMDRCKRESKTNKTRNE